MSNPPPVSDRLGQGVQRLVVRNTLFLTVAQTAGVPLSILMNAMMARYLGAQALGYIYVATTFNAIALLGVEWGQNGSLPALVATDKSRASVLLGTSLVWRAGTTLLAFALLEGASRALGYDDDFRTAIRIMFVAYSFSTVGNACQDTSIGLERTDIAAIRQVGEQTAQVAIVLPIVLLGGKLHAALVGYIFAVFPPLLFVVVALRRAGVHRPSFDPKALRALLERGTPFVFFGLAMVLQPNIDAIFLSKLSPAAVVGWHAAARRLIGLLCFPASALIGALYPTLCRLHAVDMKAFIRTSREAVRGASLLAIPVALGCALYPDVGTSVYSHSFAPAENNLRVLSVFLFLLYFTMPLGCAILAAGKQRAWAIVQSICVVVSVALDPLLIPWFERKWANGGIGVCVSTVASELIVVACGIWLAPSGIFDRKFWRALGLAAASGAAMVVTARLLHPILTPFLAAPISVIAYTVALWLTGGLEQSSIDAISGFLKRKMNRVKHAA